MQMKVYSKYRRTARNIAYCDCFSTVIYNIECSGTGRAEAISMIRTQSVEAPIVWMVREPEFLLS